MCRCTASYHHPRAWASLIALHTKVLRPTPQELVRNRKATDLVSSALKSTVRPGEVYVGGSSKKNTGVRGSSDVDIVVYFNDFDATDRTTDHLEKIQTALEKNPKSIKIQNITPYAVKCTVTFYPQRHCERNTVGTLSCTTDKVLTGTGWRNKVGAAGHPSPRTRWIG